MLIDAAAVQSVLKKYKIGVKGVLHVGAHECEEKSVYNGMGIMDEDVIWIDANSKLVDAAKKRGIPNCYTAALDEVERDTTFKITNNGQSSSLLDFGSHSASYPWCVVTEVVNIKTQTLTQFFERNALDCKKYNFWNFDIQGVELQVFRGSRDLLQYADCIYVEVNIQEVYKGCGQLHDMDVLLKEYGLERVMTKIEPAGWGDAVYVRRSLDQTP